MSPISSMILTTDQIAFWMNAAGSKPLLTQGEVIDIARKIQESDVNSQKRKKYVNKLVSHNLRLVVSYVNRFMAVKSRHEWGGPETLDFLQVGALGLVKAAERYDPETGYQFSTYAMFWVRSFVGRYAIKNCSIFHIPENAARNAYMFEKNGFVKKRYDSDNIKPVVKSAEDTRLVRLAQNAISLDMPVGADTMCLMDTLVSTYGNSPATDTGFTPEMECAIRAANLSDKQVLVLRYLFVEGMKPKEILTLTGLTRAQYASLRKAALEKLKTIISAV